jgi:hypothetical protein
MSSIVVASLGHVAFALIALSFLVRDIVWLRLLSIAASLFGILYNYVVPDPPLWLVIWWNAFFVAVNAFQIARLFHERRSVRFTEDERELLATVFRGFSAVEFLKLMRIGRWNERTAGAVLASEAEPLDEIHLVANGIAEVTSGGRRVGELRDGAFVGEMSFLTDAPASATVRLTESSRIVTWRKEDLRSLVSRNPTLRFALQGVLGADLSKKLMAASKAEG